MNFLLDLGKRASGLEADGYLSAGLGGERIPTFCFAAGLAVFLRHFVVGVDLDAELVVGEQNLDKDGRLGHRSLRAQERGRKLGKELVETLAGVGPG